MSMRARALERAGQLPLPLTSQAMKLCVYGKHYAPATLEYFSAHATTADRLNVYCRACKTAYTRAQRQQERLLQIETQEAQDPTLETATVSSAQVELVFRIIGAGIQTFYAILEAANGQGGNLNDNQLGLAVGELIDARRIATYETPIGVRVYEMKGQAR